MSTPTDLYDGAASSDHASAYDTLEIPAAAEASSGYDSAESIQLLGPAPAAPSNSRLLDTARDSYADGDLNTSGYATAEDIGIALPAAQPQAQAPAPAEPLKKAPEAPEARPVVTEEVAAMIGKKREWNEEYQRLLDALWANQARAPSDADPAAATERCEIVSSLTRLLDEFCECAKLLGRVIVSEAHLPNDSKTIKSVDVGGVAGGEKFIAYSIFFKRVSDSQGLYGSDENAMKVAGHERRGMRAYVAASSDLRTPMLTTIDYRGFRLIAMTLLPGLGKTSQIYGSSDAGRTVHCDPEAAGPMARVGEQLGLKPHRVGVGAGGQATLVAPVDIEVHRIAQPDGSNRLYVLDSARVFPPTRPDTADRVVLIPAGSGGDLQAMKVMEVTFPTARDWTSVHDAVARNILDFSPSVVVEAVPFKSGALMVYGLHDPSTPINARASDIVGYAVRGPALYVRSRRGQFLFAVFRPEFLHAYRAEGGPLLSSDAFSGFGMHGHKEHNQEVADATAYLRGKLIDQLVRDITLAKVLLVSGRQLCDLLHERGINIRFLSLVRDRLPLHWRREKNLILTEMIVRFAKNFLRWRLREVKAVGEQAVKATAAQFFNMIFGRNPASVTFWNVRAVLGVFEKFVVSGAQDASEAVLGSLRSHIDEQALFSSLQQRTGVLFSAAINARFVSDPFHFWDQAEPFKATDIDCLNVTDKRVYWEHSLLWDAIVRKLSAGQGLPTAQGPVPFWAAHAYTPSLGAAALSTLPPALAVLVKAEVERAFLPTSEEAAVAQLLVASRLLEQFRSGESGSSCELLAQARELFSGAWAFVDSRLALGEARISCLLLSARLAEASLDALERDPSAAAAAKLPTVSPTDVFDAYKTAWECAYSVFGPTVKTRFSRRQVSTYAPMTKLIKETSNSFKVETKDERVANQSDGDVDGVSRVEGHPVYLVLLDRLIAVGKRCSPVRRVTSEQWTEARFMISNLPPPDDPKIRREAFGVDGELEVEQIAYYQATADSATTTHAKEAIEKHSVDMRVAFRHARDARLMSRVIGLTNPAELAMFGVANHLDLISEEVRVRVKDILRLAEDSAWYIALKGLVDVGLAFRYANFVPQLAAAFKNEMKTADETKEATPTAALATLPEHLLFKEVPSAYAQIPLNAIAMDRYWRSFPVGAYTRHTVKNTMYTGAGGMASGYESLSFLAKKTDDACTLAKVTIYPGMATGYVMPLSAANMVPSATAETKALPIGPAAIPAESSRATDPEFALDPAAPSAHIAASLYTSTYSTEAPGCVTRGELKCWMPSEPDLTRRAIEGLKVYSKNETLITNGATMFSESCSVISNLMEKHTIGGKELTCYRTFTELKFDSKPPGHTESVRCPEVPGFLVLEELSMYAVVGMRNVTQNVLTEWGVLTEEEMAKWKKDTNMIY